MAYQSRVQASRGRATERGCPGRERCSRKAQSAIKVWNGSCQVGRKTAPAGVGESFGVRKSLSGGTASINASAVERIECRGEWRCRALAIARPERGVERWPEAVEDALPTQNGDATFARVPSHRRAAQPQGLQGWSLAHEFAQLIIARRRGGPRGSPTYIIRRHMRRSLRASRFRCARRWCCRSGG
jgi:hypothetical protein